MLARSVPRLPGARCREPAAREVFDQARERGGGCRGARLEAVKICEACPALERCRRWVDGLEPAERPRGVVAGVVVSYRDVVLAARIARHGGKRSA